jgi:hypothetical protein
MLDIELPIQRPAITARTWDGIWKRLKSTEFSFLGLVEVYLELTAEKQIEIPGLQALKETRFPRNACNKAPISG